MMFHKIKNTLQRIIVVIDKKYLSNKYNIKKNLCVSLKIIRILNKRKFNFFSISCIDNIPSCMSLYYFTAIIFNDNGINM